jgi:hypothetical protein
VGTPSGPGNALHDLDSVAQEDTQLRHAEGVGPETEPDRERGGIEPEAVARFRQRVPLQTTGYRHPGALERPADGLFLAPPQRLSHPEQDRASIGDQGRIVHEHGVGMIRE